MRTFLKVSTGGLLGVAGYAVYQIFVHCVVGLSVPIFSPRSSVEWWLVLPFGFTLGAASACAYFSKERKSVVWSGAAGGIAGIFMCAAFISFLAVCSAAISVNDVLSLFVIYGPLLLWSAHLLSTARQASGQIAPA